MSEAADGIRLNLGCGFRKKEGFVNADCSETCCPDVKIDLAVETWPWPDSSVAEVHFDLSLEQMGETRSQFLRVFKELYRVCRHEASVHILTLHPRHDDFVMNPLCAHPISPKFLGALSFQENMRQITDGLNHDKLSFDLGVNFVMAKTDLLLSEELEGQINQGTLTKEKILERMHHENNLCHGFRFELRAIK